LQKSVTVSRGDSTFRPVGTVKHWPSLCVHVSACVDACMCVEKTGRMTGIFFWALQQFGKKNWRGCVETKMFMLPSKSMMIYDIYNFLRVFILMGILTLVLSVMWTTTWNLCK
jgi:hypothetical protein